VEEVLWPHCCIPLTYGAEGVNFEGLLLRRGFVDAYKQAITDLDGPQALARYVAQRSHQDNNYASKGEITQVQDYIDKKGKPRSLNLSDFVVA
jgi:hypothetical protein